MDPLRAALEIREQLASEKRKLAFFFGAGTSMAVGLPGILALTGMVEERLQEPDKKLFATIKETLPPGINVENILDRIRTIHELIRDSKDGYSGIKDAASAKSLDSAICQCICEIVSCDPPKGVKPHLIFSQWLRAIHTSRDRPVEVFTTNYDLLLESAMEEAGLPFFDGFIGSVAPFFAPESVEIGDGTEIQSSYPPRAWTRLWKVHGSINWHIRKSVTGERERITRLSGSANAKGGELVIFPSREKYAESRKLPFLAFQDRLRKLLTSGECLVIVVGYSFSDEHLNEIMFQGLRSNPRLAIMALMHSELSERSIQFGREYRNLTLFGTDKSCIGGIISPWVEPSKIRKETEVWPFWDEESKRFTVGDFNFFAEFVEAFIGFRSFSPIPDRDILNTSASKNTKNEN